MKLTIFAPVLVPSISSSVFAHGTDAGFKARLKLTAAVGKVQR